MKQRLNLSFVTLKYKTTPTPLFEVKLGYKLFEIYKDF